MRKEEESLDNIGQYWVDCATPDAKFNAISNIYGVVTIGQAMIFCQTRKTASWLAEKMIAEGHAVALLSGELSVEERISVCKGSSHKRPEYILRFISLSGNGRLRFTRNVRL